MGLKVPEHNSSCGNMYYAQCACKIDSACSMRQINYERSRSSCGSSIHNRLAAAAPLAVQLEQRTSLKLEAVTRREDA